MTTTTTGSLVNRENPPEKKTRSKKLEATDNQCAGFTFPEGSQKRILKILEGKGEKKSGKNTSLLRREKGQGREG